MSIGRRISSDSRRRRVLVYQSSREGESGSGVDRRKVEKLRQARRPPTTYGFSVNRRLRGRWFSLVPVRRRAMAGVSAVAIGAAALLCLAHWLAITWQPLAYREAIARPLRLDRPDSFGTWLRATYLALAAGTSLLVYQLRRYRSDDYRGSYRIWPPVIILIALAGLDCIVALVPWCGELIDLLLGKRIALAGSDWIRIGLTVGGAALSLRLVAEVWHSKLSTVMMLLSILCFATPLANRWGIVISDTPLKWWLITSAPLMAAATLCVACVAYLRKLFREVRRLDEEDRLTRRYQQWKERTFPAKTPAPATDSVEPPAGKRTAAKSKASKAPGEAGSREPAGAEEPSTEQPAAGRKWLAWLKWPAPRVRQPNEESEAADPALAKAKPQPVALDDPADDPVVSAGPAKRRDRQAAAPRDKQAAEVSDNEQPPAAVTKQRRGLRQRLAGLLRRSKRSADATEIDPVSSDSGAAAAGERTPEPAEDDQQVAAPRVTRGRGLRERLGGLLRRHRRAAAGDTEAAIDSSARNYRPSVDERAAESASEDEPSSAVIRPRRGVAQLFGGLLGRRKRAAAAEDAGADSDSAAELADSNSQADGRRGGSPTAQGPAAARASHSGEDSEIDPADDPSIDWDSMNKAERRRLRRELKRNSDAA